MREAGTASGMYKEPHPFSSQLWDGFTPTLGVLSCTALPDPGSWHLPCAPAGQVWFLSHAAGEVGRVLFIPRTSDTWFEVMLE